MAGGNFSRGARHCKRAKLSSRGEIGAPCRRRGWLRCARHDGFVEPARRHRRRKSFDAGPARRRGWRRSAHSRPPCNPALSLPKDKIRVLLLEGVNDSAVARFTQAGYVNLERLPKALDGQALVDAVKGVHILGIRSRTRLTAPVLEAADRLMAVGCFSVGTNQVDLDAAERLGVPVFNAPFSNTRSVAELVIGEIVMLLRRILPRSASAHQGGWDKSANDSHEVRGKTLGIVGYGNIGSQLSYLAEAMGMRVIFYDHTDKLRHGNTEPAREPARAARRKRRRLAACAGDAGDPEA